MIRAGWKISMAGCNCIPWAQPSNNELLGTSFQNALRALWDEARKGFEVHWWVYTNGHRSPYGLRDARKGIDVRQVSVLNTA